MFLFEDFIYDDEWAKANYGVSYKHNNWYLEGIINDYKFKQSLPKDQIERFNFAVSRYTEIPDVNNLYKITYAVHYAWKPDEPFKQDQIDYLTKKLSILGDAVKIIIPHYEATMIIQYFIEKDEYRWNREYNRVMAKENAVNNIVIPKPTYESWTFMLDAWDSGKNPRIIFKNKKFNLEKLLEYIVIAYKLNWTAAVTSIKHNLYRFLKSDTVNKNNPLDNTCDAAYKYSCTYEPDDEIQEIINDYKSVAKHIGSIPIRGKYIAEKLNNNQLIKKFEFKRCDKSYSRSPILLIKVDLVNDRYGYIVVQHYDSIYRLTAYSQFDDNQMRTEYRIGNEYYSPWNKSRSKHLLEDTVDLYLDQLINDIYKS